MLTVVPLMLAVGIAGMPEEPTFDGDGAEELDQVHEQFLKEELASVPQSFTLRYFATRGLAEPIRLALAATGLEWKVDGCMRARARTTIHMSDTQNTHVYIQVYTHVSLCAGGEPQRCTIHRAGLMGRAEGRGDAVR